MNFKNTVNLGEHEKNSNPIVITFVGPKKTGKTTLMKSLASHFLKNYNEFSNGPLIIISDKQTPLIFIESPLDTLSIANLSKASDIVIFLIDGFFGLELETFECISFLNSHGTPRVLSVVTHIDLFSNWKNLTKAKKRLKNRLKKELGTNLKTFFFSGLTYSGKYLPREITNLTRFFSLINFYPSALQKKSSYMIVLKINIFNLKNKEHLSFEGFLKGKDFEKRSKLNVYSPGIGPMSIKNLKKIKIKNYHFKKFRKNFNFISTIKIQKKKDTLLLKNSRKNKIFLTPNILNFFHFFLKKIKKKKLFQKNIINSFNSSKLFDRFYPEKLSEKFLSLEKKKNIFLNYFLKENQKILKENEKKITFIGTKEEDLKPNSKILIKKKKIMESFLYILLEIDIEKISLLFFRFFDLSYPVILCFFPYQKKNQLLNGKIFRHKWNKKIVHSREKIFLSFGWNFIETYVYFFSEKEGGKPCIRKYLKKSSEYSVCFRGPNFFHETGLVGFFQTISSFSSQEKGSFFNILFTGKVFNPEKTPKIFKKIKIEGSSFRSFNKTAFIKNIFSNEIEVRRFLGNKIFGEKGEEGFIKNPIREGPSGSFRAVFDRKIGSKKKIFLRLWIPLKFNDKVLESKFFLTSHDEREIQRKFSLSNSK